MRLISGSMQRMSRASIGNPLNIRRKSGPLARLKSRLANEGLEPRRVDRTSSCYERQINVHFPSRSMRRLSYAFRSFHPSTVISEIIGTRKGFEHAVIQWLCYLKQRCPVDITSLQSRFRRGQADIGSSRYRSETNDLNIECSNPIALSNSSLTLLTAGVVRKLLISCTLSMILSSVPRGIPAINESSWSKLTNGVRTGMAMSNVLNTGVFNSVGLKVLIICLAKLYDL